jgi:hypothetical protein
MDWLWKSLFARIVWELLVILGAGAVFAWIKQKLPQFQAVAIYVLISVTCVCIIWFTIIGRPIFAPEPQKVTEQNVGTYVRTWLDEAGLTVRKLDNDKAIFEYEIVVTKNTEPTVKVAQLKQYDKRLVIHTGIVFGGDAKAAIGNLTRAQRDRIGSLMSIELAKTGTVFAVNNELERVDINTDALVTSNLTDDVLFRKIEEVYDAAIIAQNSMRLQLTSTENLNHH